MNICPLTRLMGNIPLLISGILHSTPLKEISSSKFRNHLSITVTKIYFLWFLLNDI
jgi:hypothetical protein